MEGRSEDVVAGARYAVDVSTAVGPGYSGYLDDVARMLCIQFTIQLMLSLMGNGVSLFSVDFVLLMVYVVLGVSLYWLVFKRLVVFR